MNTEQLQMILEALGTATEGAATLFVMYLLIPGLFKVIVTSLIVGGIYAVIKGILNTVAAVESANDTFKQIRSHIGSGSYGELTNEQRRQAVQWILQKIMDEKGPRK